MQNKSKPEHLLMELLAAINNLRAPGTALRDVDRRLTRAIGNAEEYLRDQGLHLLP